MKEGTMTKGERSRISRRQFLKYSAMAGAAAALPWQRAFGATKTGAGIGPYGIGSPNLTKFIDPIRGIGTDIPLASPNQNWVGQSPATHYTIDIGEYREVLHSDFITVGKPAYMGAS